MKRRILQLALFLLLGAILNVAVAWGCVRWSTVSSDLVAIRAWIRDDNCWIGIERTLGFGLELHQLWNTYARGITPDPESMIITGNPSIQNEPERTIAVATPHWSKLGIDAANPNVTVEMEQASGWPVLSMHCNILEWDNSNSRYLKNPSAGLVADKSTWPISRVYPLGIVWPGFAINTIFYAAILWLPFAALGTFRRRRRIKRGLCPKCAYDLRGITSQTCPECGASSA